MHVLQVVPALRLGGVERGVVDLAKGLLARGHRVSVVSNGGPLVERLLDAGGMHYRLPVHDKSPARVWSCAQALTRLITTTGVDLVHARSRVPAWAGYWAARRAQRPFVTTAHGFYAPHPLSRIMVRGRCVIVPSDALAQYLMEHFGVSRERLRVVPRGVDLEEFRLAPPRPSQQEWRIGLIGRLSPIKGHEVALRACDLLRREGWPVRLCLAGDPPGDARRQALEALALSLGAGEALEWLGVRDDVAQVIASMDVLVVPSTYPESFGRSVVEAQAVGRPVVASRLGGLAELIEDGVTGLLARPGDPQDLAAAVRRFLQDASVRARCVDAARRRVEAEWSLDRMVERTLAVYDECLHKPRIAIWKLSALGDVILSTPSLRAVRRRYPEAHLALIVGRSAYEAVAHSPYLNDCVIYNPASKERGPRGAWAFARRLRREAFDLSIDLQNSRRTHLLAWAAGIPVRVGYHRKFGAALNRGVRLPRVVLAPVAHQQYLLRQAGIEPSGDELELWPSTQDEAVARTLLPDPEVPGQATVGLHPGGSGRWKTKRWDLGRWAQLADALARQGLRVVITGGPGEQGLAEAMGSQMTSKPLVLVGRTRILELACVIKRCQAFVAHDSSPLHLAAAMGTPTVALFGPTDPRRHLPPGFKGQVIKRDVFCAPCYSATCRTVTHACMQRIAVADVLGAVLAAVSGTAGS